MRYLRVLQVMEGLVDADGEEDNEVEVAAVPAAMWYFTWVYCCLSSWFFSSLLAVWESGCSLRSWQSLSSCAAALLEDATYTLMAALGQIKRSVQCNSTLPAAKGGQLNHRHWCCQCSCILSLLQVRDCCSSSGPSPLIMYTHWHIWHTYIHASSVPTGLIIFSSVTSPKQRWRRLSPKTRYTAVGTWIFQDVFFWKVESLIQQVKWLLTKRKRCYGGVCSVQKELFFVFLIKIRDRTKQPEARGEMDEERCLWFRFEILF